MEFSILGPVEATVAGQQINIGHARQRAVLAVLLLDLNQQVPDDRMIDRLWGEDPPASARNLIYGYAARLRASLASAEDPAVVLARRAGGYVLIAAPDQLDLHCFRRQVAQAGLDDGEHAEVLRRALGLWRGQALAGLNSPWFRAMRDSLELQRLAAVLDLNDIALRQGQHGALISELTGQAAAHPADERLAGQLMLALYRSGRQADALQCYEQTRRQLAEELGADPGHELQTLHQRILRGDQLLATPDSVDLRPGPVPRQLPTDVPAFTGRAKELADLDRLLGHSTGNGNDANARQADRNAPAVVISAVSGTAGVGKTALAIRWAHLVADKFPDGQLYVNLRGYDPAQPMLPADALAGFLRALGVPGQDMPVELEERAARYRSLLAGRRMLIVLDNASAASQVRPLLPGTPGCSTLVTSRDALAGLVARDGARRLDLDLLPQSDAVSLLQALIGARADADPQATAALAAQCARLPLALRVAAEVAAARPAVSLAGVVSELADLQRRLTLLDAGGDSHTAVRAVFSWSYRQLDAEAARAFRLVGLHPGPDLSAYATATLTGATVSQSTDVLDRLTRAHLIRSASHGRHDMHDLLRAYACDLAAAHDGADEQRAALTRLFDHYLYGAATAMDTLFPAEQGRRPRIPRPAGPAPPLTDPAAARTWLDAERTCLVAVAAYMATNGWPDYTVRLASILFRYLDVSGYVAEALIIHNHARRAASHSGDRSGEAKALTSLGSVAFRQGRHPEAANYYQQALQLCRETGDRAGEARALHNLGLSEIELGDWHRAFGHLQEALPMYGVVRDRVGEARALGHLGVVDLKQGRFEEAASRNRQALAVLREVGDRLGESNTLARLGLIELHQRNLSAAAGHLQQALIVCREAGDRFAEADAMSTLGDVEFRQGKYELAASNVRRALEMYREIGSKSGEARALNILGDALLACGLPDQARSHHTTALGLCAQAGDQEEQARALNGLAAGYRADGDLGQARYHWEQALALYSGLGALEAEEVAAQLAATKNDIAAI